MIGALLVALQASTAQPSFPEAPPGWLREHIDFPLSFAPELELAGFEELAFAPGMMAPDSDSYFSYALALQLEGEHEVDAAFLDSFLETYYRGLCRAVAAERGLELDLASISAEVLPADSHHRATVALFDPFTDGRALELVIELESHARPRATELLGLASPLDPAAPVWKELHAVRERWRAARPAPVFLNHVYFVVDGATYDALARSEFLRRSFAVSEERETVRADGAYSGLYLYGERTYIEFLPPGAAGLAEGASGLALGLEREGATDELERSLAALSVPAMTAPITRALEDQQVPWFRLLGMEMPSAALSLFTLEYDPRFLAGWRADLPPSEAGVTRRAVLERYAAALDATALRASAPFGDVTEVQLALDGAQRERVLAVLGGCGHEIEQRGDEWLVHAPQFRLVLRPSASAGGVTALELALRRPLEHAPLQLGKLSLSFRERVATLSWSVDGQR